MGYRWRYAYQRDSGQVSSTWCFCNEDREESGETILIVDEQEITAYRDQLARLGFYLSSTSAVVLAGLALPDEFLGGPIVFELTGSN